MSISVGVDLHKTQFTVFARVGEGFFGKYQTTEDGYEAFLARIRCGERKGSRSRWASSRPAIRGTSKTGWSERASR